MKSFTGKNLNIDLVVVWCEVVSDALFSHASLLSLRKACACEKKAGRRE